MTTSENSLIWLRLMAGSRLARSPLVEQIERRKCGYEPADDRENERNTTPL